MKETMSVIRGSIYALLARWGSVQWLNFLEWFVIAIIQLLKVYSIRFLCWNCHYLIWLYYWWSVWSVLAEPILSRVSQLIGVCYIFICLDFVRYVIGHLSIDFLICSVLLWCFALDEPPFSLSLLMDHERLLGHITLSHFVGCQHFVRIFRCCLFIQLCQFPCRCGCCRGLWVVVRWWNHKSLSVSGHRLRLSLIMCIIKPRFINVVSSFSFRIHFDTLSYAMYIFSVIFSCVLKLCLEHWLLGWR